MNDSVIFDFHDGDNTYLVEVSYEDDGGRPLILDVECFLIDPVTTPPKVTMARFDPSPLFIQERDIDKRLTGKLIPLKEAIERKAFDKAQAEIDECHANKADALADARKDAHQPAGTE